MYGRSLYLLGEGRLVNLAAGDGHPTEIMDLSFAIQALSALHIVENHNNMENKVYIMPDEVNMNVAQIKLTAMNIGIDKLTSAFIPYLSTAFLIFFFRQNTKMFPKELLEAARIDGLSELGCFFRIYVPTMKTTYAAAGIITFMSSWNNYLWPLIVLQSPENQTISLLISNLGSSYSPNFGVIMLAIIIATIPTAAVFFFLQKHFVAGMVGSIK